jgi:hypothetical protein
MDPCHRLAECCLELHYYRAVTMYDCFIPASEAAQSTRHIWEPSIIVMNHGGDLEQPAGWGGWMKGFAPDLYGGERGSPLVVFALP